MIRKIIQIDSDKCSGCGACVKACHEGAIGMVGGKAMLLREDYCDGLGDCLPACPADAIHFVEREAAAYDESAVGAARSVAFKTPHVCPGVAARSIRRDAPFAETAPEAASQLTQWPVQLRLVPARASYFEGAHLLIAADCAAYAYGDFHRKFIRGHVVLIGCPKLDDADYTQKLTAILQNNDIQSIYVARMEVPCCGGLENAVRRAIVCSGKEISLSVSVISTDGRIVHE